MIQRLGFPESDFDECLSFVDLPILPVASVQFFLELSLARSLTQLSSAQLYSAHLSPAQPSLASQR